jgi:hypothetical protein
MEVNLELERNNKKMEGFEGCVKTGFKWLAGIVLLVIIVKVTYEMHLFEKLKVEHAECEEILHIQKGNTEVLRQKLIYLSTIDSIIKSY